MRRVREARPGVPMLPVTHDHESADGTPPGVPSLRDPFTSNQLLLVVGSLLA